MRVCSCKFEGQMFASTHAAMIFETAKPKDCCPNGDRYQAEYLSFGVVNSAQKKNLKRCA